MTHSLGHSGFIAVFAVEGPIVLLERGALPSVSAVAMGGVHFFCDNVWVGGVCQVASIRNARTQGFLAVHCIATR